MYACALPLPALLLHVRSLNSTKAPAEMPLQLWTAVSGWRTDAGCGWTPYPCLSWRCHVACDSCVLCMLCVPDFSSLWEAVAQNRVRMGTFVLVGQTSGLQSLLQMGGFRGSVGKCLLYVAQVVWSSFLHTRNGWQ